VIRLLPASLVMLFVAIQYFQFGKYISKFLFRVLGIIGQCRKKEDDK
jgi:hypothetical protein